MLLAFKLALLLPLMLLARMLDHSLALDHLLFFGQSDQMQLSIQGKQLKLLRVLRLQLDMGKLGQLMANLLASDLRLKDLDRVLAIDLFMKSCLCSDPYLSRL